MLSFLDIFKTNYIINTAKLECPFIDTIYIT